MRFSHSLAVVAAFTLAVPLALAASISPAHARVSAIGIIDYTKKNFSVGDWVRYRVDLSTTRGIEDVKQQEVRIVGEETYRGEKCFWVETWYGPDEETASFDLTLMSYEVFKDVAPDVHYRNYIRLVLLGMDNDGVPEMNDLQRSNPNAAPPDLRPYRGIVDTLGVETIETARGKIESRLVRLQRTLSKSRAIADSTVNRISDVTRKTWLSRSVPVTSLVREEETTNQLMQAYALGTTSTDAPRILLSGLDRTATVVDWGKGASSDLLVQWREGRGLLRVEPHETALEE
jgi:hypothetical protein